MPQIPLPPVRSKLVPAKVLEGKGDKVSRFRRAVSWLGVPAAVWIGAGPIRDGVAFASDIVRRMRTKAPRDPRFKLAGDGRFDLAATGFSFGLSAVELQRQLRARRRQTAYAAYLLGGLGAVLFVAWLVQVLHTPLTVGRLVLALEFVPASLMCGLLAFHQALVNFQIRTGRAASWRCFVTSDQGFWPRR